jgi:hypothetical protein
MQRAMTKMEEEMEMMKFHQAYLPQAEPSL